MLEFYDVSQNTDEWLQLRAGKPTSSKMGIIMANYGKAFGEPAKKYAVDIAVERLTGNPTSSGYSNNHMERGHEQEPVARILYEDRFFCDVTNGGFWGDDCFGCSPDGMVGDNGCIEIKSVIASVHYANIKRNNVDPAYKWQCISNMYFTNSDWIDFISYCEQFPDNKKLFVHRMSRYDYSDEFVMINNRLKEFNILINEVKQTIIGSN